MQNSFFRKKNTINAGGKLIDLSIPAVMGIINVTPDSFFENSRKQTIDDVLQQAEKMLNQGAAFIDLGAYSSRPGAKDISVQEESDRLMPVLEAIVKDLPQAVISIDTFRAKVAETAIRAGAHIINDISGGELDPEMFATIARLQVPYILMHMKGNPQNMQQHANYENIFTEVYDYFVKKIHDLKQLNVHDVILDPGFGFAKTPEQSYDLLRRLQDFDKLQLPILVGISRKKMIYGKLGTSPDEALNGTTVLNTIALLKGTNILRVHDVKEAVEALKLTQLINNN